MDEAMKPQIDKTVAELMVLVHVYVHAVETHEEGISDKRQVFESALRTALLAAALPKESPPVPPREPNDAMQLAGAQAIRFDTTVFNKMWTASAVWRAMHDAAAPSAPEGSKT